MAPKRPHRTGEFDTEGRPISVASSTVEQRATAPAPMPPEADEPCLHCGMPLVFDAAAGEWRHSEPGSERALALSCPMALDAPSAVAPTADGAAELRAAGRLLTAGLDAGLTSDQAVAAVTAGMDIDQFVEHSIRLGITFDEAMEAHTVLGDIGHYNFIREEAGCGHAAVMAAFADPDCELEQWAGDQRELRRDRRFNPSAERLAFGQSRIYQCEPGVEVFLETGHFPSNTFVGASQALGKVFRRHRLGADDRIVENPGGRWVATADGRVFAARFTSHDQHLFVRGPVPKDPAPPVGYRCDPMPFAQVGVRQELATFAPDVVYRSMTRFGAMDFVENTGPGL